MKPQPNQERKRELALIHMAKAHFKFSQDDYQAVLREVTGKTSSADLDAAGRDKLLKHFKAKGFKVLRSGKTVDAANEPQIRKLRAMYYMLAEAGAVERPRNQAECNAAIEAWAKRQAEGRKVGRIDALRFADHMQLRHLIEEMKQWGQRVGADI